MKALRAGGIRLRRPSLPLSSLPLSSLLLTRLLIEASRPTASLHAPRLARSRTRSGALNWPRSAGRAEREPDPRERVLQRDDGDDVEDPRVVEALGAPSGVEIPPAPLLLDRQLPSLTTARLDALETWRVRNER